jgi:hypothetical protein
MRRKQAGPLPGIQKNMPDPVAPHPHPLKRSKDPNFMAVVAIAMVVVLLFFVGAWLFVHREGKHLLPKTQPDHEPHSSLSVPGLERAA